NTEIRGEPRRLGGPVSNDGGRRDHERGARTVGGGKHAGQHGRRLAETHVEGEATSEPCRVEEPEPRQGLGLITTERSVKAVGRVPRLGLQLRGGGEQIGGPPATRNGNAARER